MSGEKILEAAASPKYRGIPYALPPDPAGRSSIDCSLYVLMVFRDAGQPFPAGVRTAEQIRQVCEPISDNDVQPGDLLFFANTYATAGASHVGISLGAGSGVMLDAHERAGGAVARTNVLSPYWQGHWMEARRWTPAQPQPPSGVKRMRVDAWGLNLRDGPTEQAKRLRTLAHGTVVRVSPYAWREILDEQGLPIGWVADEYLEEA